MPNLSNGLTIATLLASTAVAAPLASKSHQHLYSRQDSTFTISVQNNCGFQKTVGLFQTDGITMNSMSSATPLAPGGSTSIQAPYHAIGMRLSGTADQGPTAQWSPQALFEFGYSSSGGLEGTAYNLSLMVGSPGDTGIAVHPGNGACASKSCSPGNCPADQGWTSPTQSVQGSPADATCYYGMTSFAVTFCP